MFTGRLEGHDLTVIQRTYIDIGDRPGNYKVIFAIGTLDRGQFHILRWKQNTGDEQETMLETVALKNGRQFLLTVANDPESHWYRVYGFRAGRLALIYTGGGSSC